MGRVKVDLTGERFGKLLVLEFSGVKNGKYKWLALCDCGVKKDFSSGHLKDGTSTSCGCSRTEAVRKAKTIHGFFGSRTYESWTSMHQRCSNKNSVVYDSYGGRGITVDQSWNSFEQFLKDMGPRPEGKTLDRKDNDGPYSAINCRWATPKEQAKNRRKPVYLTEEQKAKALDLLKTLTVAEVASLVGCSGLSIYKLRKKK